MKNRKEVWMRKDLVVMSLNDEKLLGNLKRLKSQERKCQAKFLIHLAEVDRRKLHLELAYPSLFKYVVEELGLSESSALKRIQICRAGRKFPEIFSLIEEGKVSLSVLNKIAPHLSFKNRDYWIPLACGKSVREIEYELAKVFPEEDREDRIGRKVRALSQDRVEIRFCASRDFAAKLQVAQDKLRHRFPEGKLEDILSFALDKLLDNSTKSRKTVQKPKPAASNTQATPSRYIRRIIRKEVETRDGKKCSFRNPLSGKTCDATAWLEYDHIYPFAWGGSNDSKNLRLLCRNHNQFLQRKSGVGVSFIRNVSS
jgi:hypothetical protein